MACATQRRGHGVPSAWLLFIWLSTYSLAADGVSSTLSNVLESENYNPADLSSPSHPSEAAAVNNSARQLQQQVRSMAFLWSRDNRHVRNFFTTCAYWEFMRRRGNRDRDARSNREWWRTWSGDRLWSRNDRTVDNVWSLSDHKLRVFGGRNVWANDYPGAEDQTDRWLAAECESGYVFFNVGGWRDSDGDSCWQHRKVHVDFESPWVQCGCWVCSREFGGYDHPSTETGNIQAFRFVWPFTLFYEAVGRRMIYGREGRYQWAINDMTGDSITDGVRDKWGVSDVRVQKDNSRVWTSSEYARMEIRKEGTGSGTQIFARCDEHSGLYTLRPNTDFIEQTLFFCGPKHHERTRWTTAESYVARAAYNLHGGTGSRMEGNGWFVDVPVRRAVQCTRKCNDHEFSYGCDWDGGSDYGCWRCADYCGMDMWTDRDRCGGGADSYWGVFPRGYGFPPCYSCRDIRWNGDERLGSFVRDFYVWENRLRSTLECGYGSWNSLAQRTEERMTCTPYGWDIGLWSRVCKPCLPPRVPLTRSSFPRFPRHKGITFGMDALRNNPRDDRSFMYECADGMWSQRGALSEYFCDRDGGNAGGWVTSGVYAGPPVCECFGIGSTHSCSLASRSDDWILDGNGMLTFRYRAHNGVWPSDSSRPEWRGQLLGAVRIIFEIDAPDTADRDPLRYQFELASNQRAEDLRNGELVLVNDRQAQANSAYFPARAILRFTSPRSTNIGQRIEVMTTSSSAPRNLLAWEDSETGIRRKMPNAHAYFMVPLFAHEFSISVRVTGQGDQASKGLLQLYRDRDDKLNKDWYNQIPNYFSDRAHTSVRFEWLSRDCPRGDYSVADRCEPCPNNTFVDLPYQARTYKPDNSLRTVRRTADTPKDEATVCTLCSCTSCQSCNRQSGACSPLPDFCSIGADCVTRGARAPNQQCVSCRPEVANTRYSNTSRGVGCDDDDACTFFDECNGSGFCAGRPADCLRSSVNPAQDCEICGRNRCELKPNYLGCVSRLENGSKACGCSIRGICYPHGAENPANPCQMCDVVRDPAGWSTTPPKPCNDGNLCTYGDQCSAGVCTGVPLPCGVRPDTPCVRSSVCQGTDKCLVVFHNSSQMCSTGDGACIAPAFCTGSQAACPPAQQRNNAVQAGLLSFQPPSSVNSSVRAQLEAAMAKASVQPPGFPGEYIRGLPLVQPGAVQLSLSQWSVGCGSVLLKVGAMVNSSGSALCPISLSGEVPFRLGTGPWLDNGQILRVPAPANASRLFDTNTSIPTLQSVADGTLVTFIVEASPRGGTGLNRTVCFNVLADSSPPSAGRVVVTDTLGTRAQRTVHPSFISTLEMAFGWEGFSDLAASTWGGFLHYQYAIGLQPQGTQVEPWTDAPFGTQSTATRALQQPLPVGIPVFVSVRAYNRAGLSTIAVSAPVTVDTTPPTAGQVFNGLIRNAGGTPMQMRIITRAQVAQEPVLTAQWTAFSDSLAGIEGYQVSFGSSPGATDILPWSAVLQPSARNFSVPFNAWQQGVLYIANVRAIDAAGNTAMNSSTGMIFDETPPSGARLTWVPSSIANGVVGCSRIAVRHTSVELESWVTSALAWVGTSANGSDIFPPRMMSHADAASTIMFISIPSSFHGRTIFVTARIINVGGLLSAPASISAPLDCAAPVTSGGAAFVSNPGSDTFAFPTGPLVRALNTTSLGVAWQPCTARSGIARYELRLLATTAAPASSTAAGPSLEDLALVENTTVRVEEILPWRAVGTGTSVRVDSFVPSGYVDMRTYRVQVRCISGLEAVSVLPGIAQSSVAIDRVAPIINALRLHQPQFSSNSSFLTYSWNVSKIGSPISMIRYAVLVAGQPAPVASHGGWVFQLGNASLVGTRNATGLSLVSGASYTVALEVTDLAGHRVTAVSPTSVLIDVTAPTSVGLLVDGQGALDQAISVTMAVDSHYIATWTNLCSDSISGITGYTLCAGLSAGACDATALVRFNSSVTTARIPLLAPFNRGGISSCSIDRTRMLIEDAAHAAHTSGSGERALSDHSSSRGERVLQISTGAVIDDDRAPPSFLSGLAQCLTASASVLLGSSQFSALQLCPGNSISAVAVGTGVAVSFSHRGWASVYMGGTSLWSHELHSSSQPCLPSGTLQASVYYVCASNDVPNITLVDMQPCSVAITVATVAVCDVNMALASASPSASPATATLVAGLVTATPSSTPSAAPTMIARAPAIGSSVSSEVASAALVADAAPYFGPDIFRTAIGSCTTVAVRACGSTASATVLPLCRGSANSSVTSVITKVTVCPAGQVSAGGVGSGMLALGWWSGWTTVQANGRAYFDKWMYSSGAVCNNQGQRWSTVVSLECGSNLTILSIQESTTQACTLNVRLAMREACSITVCAPSPLTLYGTLTCTNGAGLSTSVSSNGVVLDAAPPSGGQVQFGPLDDLLPIGETYRITTEGHLALRVPMRLTGLTSSSGLALVLVAVGSSPGAQDILPWTDTAGVLAAEVQLSFGQLQDGASLYPSFRVIASNGLAATFLSAAPALYDSSSPELFGAALAGRDGVAYNGTMWPVRTEPTFCIASLREPHTAIVDARLKLAPRGAVGSAQYAEVPLSVTQMGQASAVRIISPPRAEAPNPSIATPFRTLSRSNFAYNASGEAWTGDTSSMRLQHGGSSNRGNAVSPRVQLPNGPFRITYAQRLTQDGLCPGDGLAFYMHNDANRGRSWLDGGQLAGTCYGIWSQTAARGLGNLLLVGFSTLGAQGASKIHMASSLQDFNCDSMQTATRSDGLMPESPGDVPHSAWVGWSLTMVKEQPQWQDVTLDYYPEDPSDERSMPVWTVSVVDRDTGASVRDLRYVDSAFSLRRILGPTLEGWLGWSVGGGVCKHETLVANLRIATLLPAAVPPSHRPPAVVALRHFDFRHALNSQIYSGDDYRAQAGFNLHHLGRGGVATTRNRIAVDRALRITASFRTECVEHGFCKGFSMVLHNDPRGSSAGGDLGASLGLWSRGTRPALERYVAVAVSPAKGSPSQPSASIGMFSSLDGSSWQLLEQSSMFTGSAYSNMAVLHPDRGGSFLRLANGAETDMEVTYDPVESAWTVSLAARDEGLGRAGPFVFRDPALNLQANLGSPDAFLAFMGGDEGGNSNAYVSLTGVTVETLRDPSASPVVAVSANRTRLVCASAAHGSTLVLSCPLTDSIVTGIDFASWGSGTTCLEPTYGSCVARSSASIVRAACVGRPFCTVAASPATFGTECGTADTNTLTVVVRCTPRPRTGVRSATVRPGVVIDAPRAVLSFPTAVRHGTASLSETTLQLFGAPASRGTVWGADRINITEPFRLNFRFDAQLLNSSVQSRFTLALVFHADDRGTGTNETDTDSACLGIWNRQRAGAAPAVALVLDVLGSSAVPQGRATLGMYSTLQGSPDVNVVQAVPIQGRLRRATAYRNISMPWGTSPWVCESSCAADAQCRSWNLYVRDCQAGNAAVCQLMASAPEPLTAPVSERCSSTGAVSRGRRWGTEGVCPPTSSSVTDGSLLDLGNLPLSASSPLQWEAAVEYYPSSSLWVVTFTSLSDLPAMNMGPFTFRNPLFQLERTLGRSSAWVGLSGSNGGRRGAGNVVSVRAPGIVAVPLAREDTHLLQARQPSQILPTHFVRMDGTGRSLPSLGANQTLCLSCADNATVAWSAVSVTARQPFNLSFTFMWNATSSASHSLSNNLPLAVLFHTEDSKPAPVVATNGCPVWFNDGVPPSLTAMVMDKGTPAGVGLHTPSTRYVRAPAEKMDLYTYEVLGGCPRSTIGLSALGLLAANTAYQVSILYTTVPAPQWVITVTGPEGRRDHTMFEGPLYTLTPANSGSDRLWFGFSAASTPPSSARYAHYLSEIQLTELLHVPQSAAVRTVSTSMQGNKVTIPALSSSSSVCLSTAEPLVLSPTSDYTATIELTNAAGGTGAAAVDITTDGGKPAPFSIWPVASSLRLNDTAGVLTSLSRTSTRGLSLQADATRLQASVVVQLRDGSDGQFAPVQAYWFCVGSSLGATDIFPWTYAAEFRSVAASSVSTQLASGERVRLGLLQLLWPTPATSLRIYISVAAVSAAPLSVFPLQDIGSVATSSVPLWYDLTPPVLNQNIKPEIRVSAALARSTDVDATGTVHGGNGDTGVFGVPGGTSSLLVQWPALQDSESGLASVSVGLIRMVSDALGPRMPNTILQVAPPAPVDLYASSATVNASNALLEWKTSLCLAVEQDIGFATSAALTAVSSSTQPSCCSACTQDVNCVAFEFVASNSTCYLARAGQGMGSAGVFVSRAGSVASSWAHARPTYAAVVRAANEAGLTMELRSLPVLVDSVAPSPPATVSLLDFDNCDMTHGNLTALHRSTVYMPPQGRPNVVSACIAFTPSVDVGTGVQSYTIAVGSAPGRDDVLGWTTLRTIADQLFAFYQSNRPLPVASTPADRSPVLRFRTPAFISSGLPLFVSVRAIDAVGLTGTRTVGPVRVIPATDISTDGFVAWASANRQTTRFYHASAQAISLFWTAPGGDGAYDSIRQAVSSERTGSLIPTGLREFRVGIAASRAPLRTLAPLSSAGSAQSQSVAVRPSTSVLSSQCSASSLPGFSHSGGTRIGSLRAAPQLNTCCQACINQTGCVAWVYTSSGSSSTACELLSAVPALVSVAATVRIGFISHTEGQRLAQQNSPTAQPARFQVLPNMLATSLGGQNASSSSQAAELTACIRQGWSTAGVAWVQFYAQSNRCTTLQSVSGLEPVRPEVLEQSMGATTVLLRPPPALSYSGVVYAISNAGLSSPPVFTAPFDVAYTPVWPPAVRQGSWIGGSQSFSCAWSGAWAFGVPMTAWVGLGASAGTADLVPLRPTSLALDHMTGALVDVPYTPAQLSTASSVFCTVRVCAATGVCVNGSAATGAVVDLSAGAAGIVSIYGVASNRSAMQVPTTSMPSALTVAYQSSGQWAFIAWSSFSCGPSGIERTAGCLGDYPGGCNLAPSTLLILSNTTVLATSLQLQRTPGSGASVFATVQIRCNSGRLLESVSRGVMNDLSAPTSSVVLVGAKPIDPQRLLVAAAAAVAPVNLTQLDTNASFAAANVTVSSPAPAVLEYLSSEMSPIYCAWTNASDPEVGSLGFTYEVGLSYSCNGSSIAYSISAGRQTSIVLNASQAPAIPLVQGLVCCVVTVTSAAGLSTTSISQPIPVDWSAPIATTAVVRDGPVQGVDDDLSTESSEELSVTWQGFFDIGTGILQYQACIVSMDNFSLYEGQPCDVLNWQEAVGSDKHTFVSPGIASGRTVYLCVRAWDGTRRASRIVCSDGVTVDTTPPAISILASYDNELEAVRQGMSAAETGWPYTHLLLSADDPRRLSAGDFLPGDEALRAIGNNSLALRKLELEFAIADALNGSSTASPRLTIGTRAWDGTSTPGGDSCVLSNAFTDTFVMIDEANQGMLISSSKIGEVRGANNSTMRVSAVCKAGWYREPVLDACLPCAEGTFKTMAGDSACSICPAGTLSGAQNRAAVITDVSQQTRRGRMSDGQTNCSCWDDTQIFDQGFGTCVCKAGLYANPEWQGKLPRQYTADFAAREAAPRMCVPIPVRTGLEYKAAVGDTLDLVSLCPAGTDPNEDRTGCTCPEAGQTFDPVDGVCKCAAGLYYTTIDIGFGRQYTMCFPCAGVVVRTGALPQAQLNQTCAPCPWGTTPSEDAPGCKVDSDVIYGSATIVAGPQQTAVCPARAQVNVRSGPGLQRGILLQPTVQAAGSELVRVNNSVCVSLPRSALAANASTAIWDGVALIPGYQYALIEGQNDTAAGVSFAALRGLPGAQSIPAEWLRVLVLSINDCTVPGESLLVECTRCPEGTFQPLASPLVDPQQVLAVYGNGTQGQCMACPSLLRGSQTVSWDTTLYLNWTGIFSDGNGTGIVRYEYALGTVPGGTQVKSYTSVPPTVTTVTVPASSVQLVNGAPIFLSVVAVDAVGNRAVFTDMRPVIPDVTSPLPGLVKDGDLYAILGNASVRGSSSASASPTARTIVVVQDVAFTADGPGSATETLRLSNETDRLAQVLQVIPAELVNVTANITVEEAFLDLVLNITAFRNVTRLGVVQELPEVNVTQEQKVAANLTSGSTQPYEPFQPVVLPSQDSVPWFLDPQFVSIAAVGDVDLSAQSAQYALFWEPFLDTGSSISKLGVCVGTIPYTCDVVPMRLIPRSKLVVDTMILSDLSLPSGVQLFAMVVAVNGVGMVSRGVSNGVLIDDRVPVPGLVHDTGRYFALPQARDMLAIVRRPDVVDLDCDVPGQGIGAAWEGFSAISGLDRYEWAIGTKPYASDVQPFVSVGLASSALNTAVLVLPGTTYYTSVVAVGKNGRAVAASSDGVLIVEADTDLSDSADGMYMCRSLGTPVPRELPGTVTSGQDLLRAVDSAAGSASGTLDATGVAGLQDLIAAL